jgi:hypothetical protein
MDAVRQTLRLWPHQITATDYAARLVSVATLGQLLQNTDTSRSNATPVWIVAFLAGGGISQRDLQQPANAASSGSTYPGWYWVWDANEGEVIMSGGLYDATTPPNQLPKFAAIQAIQSESISIVTPSPPPTYSMSPTGTPGS